jgi:hypothetical protein
MLQFLVVTAGGYPINRLQIYARVLVTYTRDNVTTMQQLVIYGIQKEGSYMYYG